MPDREKVIDGLKKHITTIEASGDGHKWRFVQVKIIEAALELLKAQEPVEPRKILPCITRPVGGYVCGHCGIRFLEKNDYYCSNCGRAVKWE